MSECVFCKIIQGELPSNKVLETEHFIVIKNIAPKVPGHSLVIPKEHYKTFTDLPQELYQAFLEATKEAVQILQKETNTTGYNMGMNNGPGSGQSVHHLHCHILPRKKGDGLSAIGG